MTEAEHEAALCEIERLWGAHDGTPNGDRLDVIVSLVEEYEKVHFAMEVPD